MHSNDLPLLDLPGNAIMMQGYCLETIASENFFSECFFTFVLDEGTITANGPFNFDFQGGLEPTVMPVTGATGKYRDYHGEVSSESKPVKGETPEGLGEGWGVLRLSRRRGAPHNCCVTPTCCTR